MRPWFERLWVVQERYLARKSEIVCGRLTISWQYLEQACEALQWYNDSQLYLPDLGLNSMLRSVEIWRPRIHRQVR